MNEILVLSTVDTLESAREIATILVEKREVACVNIIPGIHSIFRWEGEIAEEGEFLLIVKSSAEKFEEIRSTIRSLHNYQIPEIIALPITAGDADYLNWLRKEIS